MPQASIMGLILSLVNSLPGASPAPTGQLGGGLGATGASCCGSPGAVAGLEGHPPPGLGGGATGLNSSCITGSPGAWGAPEAQVEPGAGVGPGRGQAGAHPQEPGR